MNKGYLSATVEVDTMVDVNKRKVEVVYNVTTGKPHYIASINYDIPNDALREIILSDTVRAKLKPNMLFDRNVMSEQRDDYTRMLREKGYYAFDKEYSIHSFFLCNNESVIDCKNTIFLHTPLVLNKKRGGNHLLEIYLLNFYFPSLSFL